VINNRTPLIRNTQSKLSLWDVAKHPKSPEVVSLKESWKAHNVKIDVLNGQCKDSWKPVLSLFFLMPADDPCFWGITLKDLTEYQYDDHLEKDINFQKTLEDILHAAPKKRNKLCVCDSSRSSSLNVASEAMVSTIEGMYHDAKSYGVPWDSNAFTGHSDRRDLIRYQQIGILLYVKNLFAFGAKVHYSNDKAFKIALRKINDKTRKDIRNSYLINLLLETARNQNDPYSKGLLIEAKESLRDRQFLFRDLGNYIEENRDTLLT